MRSPKPLIVNCGASHVSLSLFGPAAAGLPVLEKTVCADLDYDFSREQDWLSAVASKVKELAGQLGVSGSAVLLAPGSRLLSKTIRVPHVEASKQAQIIAFEARQNIPYELSEISWDSQVIADDGVETDVLFIASKRDEIDAFCRQFNASGLEPVRVDASTVLDLNVFRAAYPEKKETVLMINVGARVTNLIFISPESFFVRTIQLGGNTLTQSLADALGTEFKQAEELKVNFFSGARRYSEDDPHVKMIRGKADGFLQRLSTEITRSIVNYRRQNQGNAPEEILLTGRGSLLGGLPEFLAEKQKVGVDYLDPFSAIEPGSGVDLDSLDLERFQLSEVIGEALRLNNPEAAGIDLLPDEVRNARRFARQKPFFAAAAACLALSPVFPMLHYSKVADRLDRQQASIRQQIPPLESTRNAIFNNLDRARAVADGILRIEDLVNSKANWILFFDQLQDSLYAARDVWLDSLQVSRELPAGSREERRSGPQYDEYGEPIKRQPAPRASYEVKLSGRMLLGVRTEQGMMAVGEDFDPVNVSDRLRELTGSLSDSAFILSAGDPSIDFSAVQQGINLLPFSITLEVDPDKSL
ncbi:MAG: pilus assembly protein PilM [Opitutales bacterium]